MSSGRYAVRSRPPDLYRPSVAPVADVTDPAPASLDGPGQQRPVESHEALLDAVRAGDASAFAQLVAVWSPSLLRTAMVLTDDRRRAEELVRQTWLRLLAEVTSFRPPPRLLARLCELMLDAAGLPAVTAERTDASPPAVDPARFLPPEDPQWPGHWAVPPVVWPALEDGRPPGQGVGAVLRTAIDGLPVQQRVVVGLRDVAGCDVPEICALVRQQPERVRALLHQGRAAVRRRLDDHYAAAV